MGIIQLNKRVSEVSVKNEPEAVKNEVNEPAVEADAVVEAPVVDNEQESEAVSDDKPRKKAGRPKKSK